MSGIAELEAARRADAERTERLDRLPVGPCPVWCRAGGHGWEGVSEDGTAIRQHSVLIGGTEQADVFLLQTEEHGEPAPTLGPVTVTVVGELDSADPAEVRRLAAVLELAAAELAVIGVLR